MTITATENIEHEVAHSRSDAIVRGVKRYWGECHKHGEVFRWTSNSTCSVCTSEQVVAYRERHRQTLVKSRRAWDRKNPIKAMLQRARRRSKSLGVPFDLEASDVTIPEICPVLGIKLERHGDCVDSSPSLDRLEGHLGYVKGNVAVISHRANKLKSDASLVEMQRVLAYMENNNDN